jgi:hypothetical protein
VSINFDFRFGEEYLSDECCSTHQDNTPSTIVSIPSVDLTPDLDAQSSEDDFDCEHHTDLHFRG